MYENVNQVRSYWSSKSLTPFLGRDFSPNSKQDLSGLSGFWTVYLKKPLKNRARFERFLAVYPKKPLKNRASLERFLNGLSRKTA